MQSGGLKRNIYTCVYQNHKIIIQTKGFENDENEKITETVFKILKAQKELNSSFTHKLNLSKFGEKIEAKFDGNAVQISSESIDPLEIQNFSLKILGIKHISAPSFKNRSFIVHVFLRFINWLTGAAEGASQEVKRFLDEVNCRTYEGLLSLLQTWESLQKQELSQALKLGNKLKLLLNGKKTLSSFTKKFESELKKLHPPGSLVLPAGFYDEKKVFHPLLLLFEKREEALTLKVMSSDLTIPPTITYEIENLSNVAGFLEKMTLYMNPSIENPLNQKRSSKILETASVLTPDIELQEISRFNALFSGLKGFKEVARDPLASEGGNTMTSLLSQIAPETPLEDSLGATISLFIKHFEQSVSKIDNYTKEEQILILESLVKEYDQLDFSCRELFVTNKSISHLVPFQNLADAKKKIHLRLEALKTGQENRAKDLKSVSGHSLCKIQQKSKTSKIFSSKQFQIDPTLLGSLEKAISEKNHSVFIEKLQQFSEKLNLMVEGRQYDQVIDNATQLFNLLPPPEWGEKTFWSDISEQNILPLQKHLSAAVHYMWEAKIFRGDSYANLDETLGLALVQAGVQSLLRSKGSYAFDKLLDEIALRKNLVKELTASAELSKEVVREILSQYGMEKLAELTKQCKLPFSHFVDIFSGTLKCMNEPLNALLLTDRFVLSYDLTKHEIIEKLEKYSGRNDLNLINVDIHRDEFYEQLVKCRDKYQERKRDPFASNLQGALWINDKNAFFSDLNPESSTYLTPSIKYLRSVQCQSYSMLNPENCFRPNSSAIDKKFLKKDEKWVRQLKEEARQSNTPLDSVYRQEIRKKLQKMKRLKLDSNTSLFGSSLSVSGGFGSEKLGFNFGEIGGFSPQASLKSMANVGPIEFGVTPSIVVKYKNRFVEGRTVRDSLEDGRTETYWAKKLQSQGKKGSYDLQTMSFDHGLFVEPNSCENALQFILDFPDRLGDIGVRRWLECSLFRPPLLLKAMKDPTFLLERLPRLKELTQKTLKMGNFDVAFYLMHVVSAIDQIAPNQKGEPMGYFASFDEKNSGMDILARQLQTVESTIAEDSVRLAIYFLEAACLSEKESKNFAELIEKAYSILKLAPKGFDINALQDHVLELTERKFSELIQRVPLLKTVPCEVSLIPEIMQHASIVRIFSGKEVKGVVTEDSSKRLCYLIEGRFQVTWFKETKEFEIRQKMQDDKWYTYTEVDVSDPVSVDEAIQSYGAWVLERKAFVICGNQYEWHQKDLLEIDLSSKGDFLSIKKGSKEIGVDRQLKASKWFPCIDSSRLLFEHNRKKELEKVSFLGTDIVLEKANDLWKRGPDVLIDSSNSSHLSEPTQIIIRGLGSSIHDVGFIFKGEGNEKIEIFPYVIQGVNEEKNNLEFQKKGISAALPKPFTIEIKDGSVNTTPAGYIYMAQLCAYQKNMKQALFYLEEASKKKASLEERAEIEQVMLSLENYQPRSLREIVFKLKAELLFAKIRRADFGIYSLMPQSEQLFLKKAQELQQLYKSYLEAKKRKSYGLKELDLTSDEIREYQHISQEALLILKTDPEKVYSKPTSEEGSYLFHYLTAYVKPDKGGITLPIIPNTDLLAYFSILYGQVKEQKLTADDLKPLFAKISLDYPLELRKAIDIARRTLWTLAGGNSSEEKPRDIGYVAEKNHELFQSLLEHKNSILLFKQLSALINNQKADELREVIEFESEWIKEFMSDMQDYSPPAFKESLLTREMIEQSQDISEEEKKMILTGFKSDSITRTDLEKNLKRQKINYVALRKEKQTEERIQQRIEKIRNRKIELSKAPLPEFENLQKPLFSENYSYLFKAEQKGDQSLDLPKIAFVDPKTLQNALESYQKERSERVQLKEGTAGIEKKVNERKIVLNQAIGEKRDSILSKVRQLKKTSPAIRSLLRKESLLGKNRLLESLLDLYQKAEGTGDNDLDKEITAFLLLSTENNLLQEVLNKIEEYKSCEGEERIDVATEIKKLLESSCTYDRYKNREAFIAKKLFVAEYRGGVILRKGQLDTIDQLRENPNLMTRLRMGLGKTTYILPVIMHILAEEKNKLPIALVPDELFNMNRMNMDKTTRRFFQQCGYEFNPNEGVFSDPLLLAQELDRLYEIKENQGYVIARLSQIARIKQNMILCDEALSGSLEKEERIEIEKKRFWLSKMNEFLSEKETQFCADEADEIFAVNRDINIALSGAEKPIHEKVRFAARFLIQAILSSQEIDLQPLKNALKAGAQASLNEKDLQKGLDTLRKAIGEYKEDVQIDIAIQKMLSGSLEDILKQSPGVDFDIQKETGYSTGPRQEKREKIGEKFSNEYEVALYNTIQYAIKGPTKSFLLKMLPGFYLAEETLFKSWVKKAEIQTKGLNFKELIEKVADFLLLPQQWQQRLDLLESGIFKEGLITLTEEEIRMNTQDIIRGKQSGGTSGTGSFYSLPEGFKTPSEQTKDVEAETFIKLAASNPKGFNAKVETCPDNELLDRLKDKISKDPSIRAIINIGLSLDGKESPEIVKELQNSGLKKTFVYIDPRNQRPYLKEWNKEPIPFDSTKRVPKDAVVFYDSADKRGADFKFGPGKILYLPGPTLEDRLCQGVWRGRQLGFGHKAEPILVESVAKSIKQNISSITLKDFLDSVMERSEATRNGIGLKAEVLKIQGIALEGVEDILYNPANNLKVNQTFYPIFRNYFVTKRETDFSLPEKGEEDVLGEKGILSQVCDQEIKLLKAAQSKLLEKLKVVFEKQKSRFHSVVNYRDLEKIKNKNQISFEEFISWQNKMKMDVSVNKSMEYVDNHYLSGEYSNIWKILERVDGLIENLEVKKKEYVNSSKSFEKHKENLPGKVKKTFSLSSGGTDQQAQQQRQQQKQSSMETGSDSLNTDLEESGYYDFHIEYLTNKQKCGLSSQALNVLLVQNGMTGGASFQLLAIEKEGEIVLRVITKQDHVAIEKSDEKFDGMIFSLDRVISDENPLGITLFKKFGNFNIGNLDETALKNIVLTRFLLDLPLSEKERKRLNIPEFDMGDFLEPQYKRNNQRFVNRPKELNAIKRLAEQLRQKLESLRN